MKEENWALKAELPKGVEVVRGKVDSVKEMKKQQQGIMKQEEERENFH